MVFHTGAFNTVSCFIRRMDVVCLLALAIKPWLLEEKKEKKRNKREKEHHKNTLFGSAITAYHTLSLVEKCPPTNL